jgi:hypothetical protein
MGKPSHYFDLFVRFLSEHDVNVSTQPPVMSEIPSDVVWVLANHDLIRIPEPVIAKSVVVWGNAEEEAPKPEALLVLSDKLENMTGTKAAREAPVLPRVVEVVVRITSAGVMTDPLAVRMNVRNVWVSLLVAKRAVFRGSMLLTLDRRRTMRRSAPTNLMFDLIAFFLSQSWNSKHEQRYSKPHNVLTIRL